MIKGIKNIILDFGGVLYDIDTNRTINAFRELSNNKDMNFNNENIYQNFINPYEKGIISSEQFRAGMKSALSLNFDDKSFDNAWNATLIGIFEDSTKIVAELKKKFNLILLSNTNPIHYNYFSKECKKLFSLFNNCFFSFKIGLSKPDAESFNYVINRMNYIPEETLFADDSRTNIKAAASLGLNTFIINGRNKLSDLLHTVL